MNKQNKKPSKKCQQGQWIGIGLVFGIVFGAAFGNVGVGLSLGLIIGVAVELIMKKKKEQNFPNDKTLHDSTPKADR